MVQQVSVVAMGGFRWWCAASIADRGAGAIGAREQTVEETVEPRALGRVMLRRQRILHRARLRARRVEKRPLRVLPPAESRARHLRVKLHRKSRAQLKRLRVIAAALAGGQQRRARRRREAVKMRLRGV